MAARRALVVAAAAGLSACALGTSACRRAPAEPPPTSSAPVAHAPSPAPPDDAGDAHEVVIAFLGDSLTAGYGLTSDLAFPHRVHEMFAAHGHADVEVLNAGVSGDTTAGGRARVRSVLAEPHVRILVVALGGNDALRGLPPEQTHDNLAAILDAALAAHVHVLLAGMEAPTNLGPGYQTAFHRVFVRLSHDYQGRIVFVPFLLAGVAGVPALNQDDGIHPNAQGAEKVAALLYPPLRTLVDRLPPSGAP